MGLKKITGDIVNNGAFLLDHEGGGVHKEHVLTGSFTNNKSLVDFNQALIDPQFTEEKVGFFKKLLSLNKNYKINGLIDGIQVDLAEGKKITNNSGLHVSNIEIKSLGTTIENNDLFVLDEGAIESSSGVAISGNGDVILLDADVNGSVSAKDLYVMGTPVGNDKPLIAREPSIPHGKQTSDLYGGDITSSNLAKFETAVIGGKVTANTKASANNSFYGFNTTFKGAIDNQNGKARFILSDIQNGVKSKGDIEIYGTKINGNVETEGKFISGAHQKELANKHFASLLNSEKIASAEDMKKLDEIMGNEENFLPLIKAATSNSHDVDSTTFYKDALKYVDSEDLISGDLIANGGIDTTGFEMKGTGVVRVAKGDINTIVSSFENTGGVYITEGNLNANNTEFASDVNIAKGDLNALGNLLTDKADKSGLNPAFNYIEDDDAINTMSRFKNINVNDGNISLTNTYAEGIIANDKATSSKTITLKNAVIDNLTHGANKKDAEFNVNANKALFGESVINYGSINAVSSVFDKDVKTKNLSLSGIVEDVERLDKEAGVYHGEISYNANIAASNNLSLTGIESAYKLDKSANTTLLQAKNINITSSAIKGQVIGNADISDDLTTGVMASGVSATNFYKDPISKGSSINLNNAIVFGDIKADKLNANGSKITGRILANDLNASNNTFIMGGTNNTFLGTMIARNSTSGANNEIGLLGLSVNNGKADASNLANLPLALLKVGAGTANAENFVTKIGVYDGLSVYSLDKKNILSGTLKQTDGDYIYYSVVANPVNAVASRADASKTSDNFSADSKSGADKSILDNASSSVGAIAQNASDVAKGTASDEVMAKANNTANDTSKIVANETSLDKAIEEAQTDIKNAAIEEAVKVENSSANGNEIELTLKGANTKALKDAKNMLNQTYYSYVSEWNNLNKRMGELRNNNGKNAGIWIRNFGGVGKIDNAKIKYYEVQFGADKQTSTNYGELYTGVMANIGQNTSNSSDSKVKNHGFGAYVSLVGNDGLYIDATARYTHHKSTFKDNVWLGDLKDSGSGFLGSVEAGYRMGSDFYLEPSAELIVGYIPMANLKGNDKVTLKSEGKFMSAAKVALSAGANINDSFGLRASVGGAFDLNKTPTITLSDGVTKRVEKGFKDSRGFASVGANFNLGNNTKFSLDAEKTFSGKYNTNYNINGTLRYSF
ncbi:autotransporter outer membrane beta-barrel domain-containing protein [Campylobacter sp. Cr9]|uniref:autotransporter outer membrane beta-barrel domain-containing protein n=1 Tax=Campylobacter sp. Cr9 TaxID=2735728 RepID=UPI003014FD7C|nr:autotransporter outer membrane beta-barrel domain-containing protein [Campylobacter sp. Cr9]